MRTTTTAMAAFAAAFCATAAVDPANTVYNAQKARAARLMPENAKRVRADFKGAPGKVAWYAVPAMSEVMRLGDTYPADGEAGGTVRCVLAQDEFESCSFELFAFEDLEDVKLDVDFPLPNDLRVVKVWFQNGNGWVSYFDDCGLKLTPELLLHDENLIDVRTGDEVGNWARQKGKDGKIGYTWISAPKGLHADGAFDAFNPGFDDAAKIQPVKLEKNAFKQFFLTIHPDKNAKPGVYKGKVTASRNGEKLAEIPLAARVLPFRLPFPRGYRNPSEPYLHSVMGAMPQYGKERFGGDERKHKAHFRAWMQSLYDHSVFHAPAIGPENAWCVPMLREIGFPLDVVFGNLMAPWFGLNFGGRMSYDQLMAHKDAADRCHEFYQKTLGHNNVLCGHGDEQGAAFVTCHREAYRFWEQYGIKIGCAGHEPLLTKGGYAYGFYPMAGAPDNAYEQARPWYEMGVGPIGFYASQHTGSENPEYTRRQHGLLGWLNGLTMSFNYEFDTRGFNDRAYELYKPMVISLANGQGLMETLEYAGFREACDDIRYATYVKQLADEAKKSGDEDAVVAARKALLYLALLKGESADLNTVRAELIEHALKIRKALGK